MDDSKKNSPKVTAIICVYNGAAKLRDAIQSVMNQTYPSYEIVVINDGSTDNSEDICMEFNDRITYVRQDNQGLPFARNCGICNSTGDYIALLDQDDVWVPRKLEQQMELFQKKPDLGLVYSDYDHIDYNDETIHPKVTAKNLKRGEILQPLFETNFIGSLTAVIPAKVFDEVGMFSENLPFALDWDLWLRIAAQYPVDYVEEPLAKWRWRENYEEFRRDSFLRDLYQVIYDRHQELAPKLSDDQNNGISNRLARVSFSLGKHFLKKENIKDANLWFRKSLEHEEFSPEQKECLNTTTLPTS